MPERVRGVPRYIADHTPVDLQYVGGQLAIISSRLGDLYQNPGLRAPIVRTLSHAHGVLGRFLDQETSRLNPIPELTIAEGEGIYKIGQPANTIYLVRAGVVEVFTETEDGRKIAVFFAKGPTFIGEDALVQSERTFNAKAVKPSTIKPVANTDLETIVAYNPTLALELLRLMAERIEQLAQRQLEGRNGNSNKVLARRLEELFGIFGPEIPLSQFDLAEYAGVTRQTVGRIYSFWRNKDIITTSRSFTHIRNIEALRELF